VEEPVNSAARKWQIVTLTGIALSSASVSAAVVDEEETTQCVDDLFQRVGGGERSNFFTFESVSWVDAWTRAGHQPTISP
jgi:hypothetical protein